MPGYGCEFRSVALLSLSLAFLCSSELRAQTADVEESSIPRAVRGAPATHKQKAIIPAADKNAGEKLEDFCVGPKGNILALVGPADTAGPDLAVLGEVVNSIQEIVGAGQRRNEVKSAVHVYDGSGKLVTKWLVGFKGQAINTAPDGSIVIGGDGRVARFGADGKKLKEAESPQMTYINANPDEMRERAKDQLESDIATYSDQVKQFEDQLKELREANSKATEKPPVAAAPEEADPEAFTEERLTLYINAYKEILERTKKQTVEDVLKLVVARASQAHSITASDKEIFVSCPAMAGYGYGVWRTDIDFGQAKEIIKSLSGCCGQMDVQCLNGELYVCENSRHRVVRFDRDGKEMAQFGKRDRTGEGENFGGCCNPMNLCFDKKGNLFVSESNGVVKHFTPSGEYLGVAGIAKVTPGCKNSCVGVTAGEDQLFYIDIEKSQIIVLSRDETVANTGK